MPTFEDKRVLLACIGASVITYNLLRAARSYLSTRHEQWIPIGTVKDLWIFPIKSCKRKEVFSLFCGKLGVSRGELHDREFIVVDEVTGKMYTARACPKMVLMEPNIVDNVLSVTIPDGRSVKVDLAEITKNPIVRRAILWDNLPADGIDCGDELAKLFSDFNDTPGMRVLMWRPELFNGRPCVTDQAWWNNPVPVRSDTVRYVDLAPYMITTEGSLKDLNSRLEKPVGSENFRANIVVDECEAWDEDKWDRVRIGDDVELECFKPCTRCVLTTIDPATGVKDAGVQPLKELRKFRLAPEGKLLEAHGQSPIFGVNAGLITPGYIHRGQVVYAKYKPSAF